MSHDPHDNSHPKHLAHHFDSMTQQFESGKLGMWLFLATELLMFGGLFCAYTIYRSTNPDVYMYAHQALDTKWGAINTVVLLFSSFTVAWGVRAAMLGQRKLLVGLMAISFVCGGLFMVIKTVEYNGKYAHGLWLGPANAFYFDTKLTNEEDGGLEQGLHYIASHGHGEAEAGHGSDAGHGEAHDSHTTSDHASASEDHATEDHAESHEADHAPAPITLVADHSSIALAAIGPVGTAPKAIEDPFAAGKVEHAYPEFDELSTLDKRRTHIFFQIYYMMTGLHGVHVLVGMAVLGWLLYKSGNTMEKAWIPSFIVAVAGLYFVFVGLHVNVSWALILGIVILVAAGVMGVVLRGKAKAAEQEDGEFNGNYFTPVEIGGLYWHLVDLIWIFLFPLLYLIR